MSRQFDHYYRDYPEHGIRVPPTDEIRTMRLMLEYFHRRPATARRMFPGTAGMRSLPVATIEEGRRSMALAHGVTFETCRFGDRISTCYHTPRCLAREGSFGRWVAREEDVNPFKWDDTWGFVNLPDTEE